MIGCVLATAGAAGVAIELARSGDRATNLVSTGAWALAGLAWILVCARFIWPRRCRPKPAPTRAVIEPFRTRLRSETWEWAAVATVIPFTSVLRGGSGFPLAAFSLGAGIGGLVVAAALRRRERRGGFVLANTPVRPGLPWRWRLPGVGRFPSHDEADQLTATYYEVPAAPSA